MSKKVIILNASPRKNWNTAKLLKSVKDGAENAGADVEYVDLFDLKFTGCRSCLLCKRKGEAGCKCYWKDDLSPLIDKIYSADALFIGTPIYLGRPTSQYFALIERMHFTALSYEDYSNHFKGKIDVSLFVTMNATKDFYDKLYKDEFEKYGKEWEFLNGEIKVIPSYNTVQVSDYSKFDMGSFSEADKRKYQEENFDNDLKNAYELGARLGV